MSSDMKKVPDKVVEYLPDALEIKNQKLPGLIKFGVNEGIRTLDLLGHTQGR